MSKSSSAIIASAANIGAGGGGGGYVTQAVSVSALPAIGANYLSCDSLACDDNGLFSIAYRFKTSMSNAIPFPLLWVSDPQGAYINLLDTNIGGAPEGSTLDSWSLFLAQTGGSSTFVVDASVHQFDGAWHQVIMSADTNFGEGSKRGKMYMDNVDVTVLIDSFGSFQSLFNGKMFTIFGDTFGGDGYVGSIADLWIAPGVSLLDGGGDIPLATRQAFGADGSPVYLGASGEIPTGSAPAMFFSKNSMDSTPFETNRGPGGIFTLHGSLPDDGSAP